MPLSSYYKQYDDINKAELERQKEVYKAKFVDYFNTERKDRILEYLAVKQNTHNLKISSPIPTSEYRAN